MPTDFIDEEIGSAVVKKSFQTRVNPNRAKEGGIGGCAIQSGIIKKDHHFRIYRKNECIYEGTFSIHQNEQNIYQNLNQIPLSICPTPQNSYRSLSQNISKIKADFKPP